MAFIAAAGCVEDFLRHVLHRYMCEVMLGSCVTVWGSPVLQRLNCAVPNVRVVGLIKKNPTKQKNQPST